MEGFDGADIDESIQSAQQKYINSFHNSLIIIF